MNCLERKQHTDSWWSCKMTSIPLRTSHLPAAVNEWTHPESIEMEIGLMPHYFSNLGDSFEDTTHHTFASHHLPPPPARSALPCPGFSLRHPTVYRCSSSRIWGPSALTRLVRRNFKRTLSERLNSFELLLDVIFSNSIIWGQLQCTSLVIIKGIFSAVDILEIQWDQLNIDFLTMRPCCYYSKM